MAAPGPKGLNVLGISAGQSARSDEGLSVGGTAENLATNAAQMIYVPPTRRYVRTVHTIGGTSTPTFNMTTFFLFSKHTAPGAVGGFNQTSAASNG
jgi:hypothetical protein